MADENVDLGNEEKSTSSVLVGTNLYNVSTMTQNTTNATPDNKVYGTLEKAAAKSTQKSEEYK